MHRTVLAAKNYRALHVYSPEAEKPCLVWSHNFIVHVKLYLLLPWPGILSDLLSPPPSIFYPSSQSNLNVISCVKLPWASKFSNELPFSFPINKLLFLCLPSRSLDPWLVESTDSEGRLYVLFIHMTNLPFRRSPYLMLGTAVKGRENQGACSLSILYSKSQIGTVPSGTCLSCHLTTLKLLGSFAPLSQYFCT